MLHMTRIQPQDINRSPRTALSLLLAHVLVLQVYVPIKQWGIRVAHPENIFFFHNEGRTNCYETLVMILTPPVFPLNP